MLEEYKRQFLRISGKNTVTASLCINVAAGIGTYEQFGSKDITHMTDRHKVYNIFLIWTDHIVIRRIFRDHIVNFLTEIGFLVMVHAVFEEIISVVLCSGGIFFVYKADMFLFPVRLCYIIKKHCGKFFKDNIQSVILFSGTVYECKLRKSCVIRIDIKIIRCTERAIVQEFHKHTTAWWDENLYQTGAFGVWIKKLNHNIPVKSVPRNRVKIKCYFYAKKISVFFNADRLKIIGNGIFEKLVSKTQNAFLVFERIGFQVKRNSKNSAAHV